MDTTTKPAIVHDLGELLIRLWPVLPPLVLAWLGSDLLMKFAAPGIEIVPPDWRDEEVAGREAARRFQVGATFLLLITVCAGSISAALSIVWRHAETAWWRTRWLIGAAVVSVVVLFLSVDGKYLFERIATGAFEMTLGGYPVASSSLCLLRCISDVGTAASGLAGAIVATAVASLHPSVSRGDLKTDAEALRLRIADLKFLLFAAAGVLFAGVIHLKSWLEWPIAFWPSGESEPFKLLATGVVQFKALHFTLVLAAIFLPMAAVLSVACRRLAQRDEELRSNPEKAARWLQSSGLTLSVTEQAQRVLALVSPFLAAPVVEVLRHVAEKAA